MSSTNQYLEFVLDLLGELEDVAQQDDGRIRPHTSVGGIYRGDRFLLKVTPASERLLA